jgi:hypothetical protein
MCDTMEETRTTPMPRPSQYDVVVGGGLGGLYALHR